MRKLSTTWPCFWQKCNFLKCWCVVRIVISPLKPIWNLQASHFTSLGLFFLLLMMIYDSCPIPEKRDREPHCNMEAAHFVASRKHSLKPPDYSLLTPYCFHIIPFTDHPLSLHIVCVPVSCFSETPSSTIIIAIVISICYVLIAGQALGSVLPMNHLI